MADTPADRLKQAREATGRYATGSDAARAFGWKVSTYLAHENGQNGLKIAAAQKYARAYHVSPGWLMTGDGEGPKKRGKAKPAQPHPSERRSPTSLPIMGFVGAGASIEPDFEQVPPEGLEQVEIPFPVPDELIGFEIRGDSMLPRYEAGDVIVCWRDQRGSIENLLGEEAVIRTADGKRYLKRLLRGPGRGVFNLESTNASAKTIESVRIEWASEVYLTVRSGQVRRIAERE